MKKNRIVRYRGFKLQYRKEIKDWTILYENPVPEKFVYLEKWYNKTFKGLCKKIDELLDPNSVSFIKSLDD